MRHLVGLDGDLIKGLVGDIHQCGPFLDLFDRSLDQGRGVFSRIGRPHGQVAHLVGHHRKPGPGFTGPGSLNSRIQGQQVGLEGDLVDGFDNFLRFLPRLGDAVHRNRHTVHGTVGRGNGLVGILHQGIGLVGMVGILLGHGRHLFQRGGCFFKTGRLLGRPFGQRLTGGGNLTGRRGHLISSPLHVGGKTRKLLADPAGQDGPEGQRNGQGHPNQHHQNLHAGSAGGLDGVAGRKKLVLEGTGPNDPVPGLEINKLAEFLRAVSSPSFFQ